MFPPIRLIAAVAAVLAAPLSASAAEKAAEFPPQPPIQALTAEQEVKTFQLPPGYRLDLVLGEPSIKEPVVCAFDGNGRMFVAEMLTYMQDIDGKAQLVPTSRVSMHTDTDGDGKYDQHTVFADNLLLPRMILPLDKGQVVIGETNTLDLYLYTDTDGDGVADKKELWFLGGPRGGNLEHQPSGLIWAIDNGIYTTYNGFRLRWTPAGVVKESVAANNGQWGAGQDDHGRMYYMNAGGEQGPVSFQTSVVYGNFNPGRQFAEGFKEVWPAVGKADFQGGRSRVREPDQTLNHFTATSGAEVYRGDRLPAELRGNLFFGEPVGRLVRRAKVEVKEGLTVLSNPHQAEKSEFLRSTDACFRPLNMVTAPDGTLYIVDMYRGIIQEGNWVNPGSYLRKVVEQYSFDKIIERGRIWRLVHETTQRGPQPRMLDETPAQLVAHLEHPNGWWRDTAQKLLILRQDKSVVPALTTMARTGENYLARLHAFWTLEGLGAANAELVREKLRDEHPQLRVAALRVSESLVKAGDKTLLADVPRMTADPEPEVVIQAMLTAKQLDVPEYKKVIADLALASTSTGVKEFRNFLLNPGAQREPTQFTAEERKILKAGAETFNTLCATCHGAEAQGAPMAGAPPGTLLGPALAGSKTINGPRDAAIYVLLHGLTGDIDGKKYEGLMIPMRDNDDAWLASVLSYIRMNFGNQAGFVTPQDVARARAATQGRTQPWTIGELRAALPKPLDRKGWKLTASHNAGAVGAAIDGKGETRFDTKTDQVPGMWFQVELPQETVIAGLRLDTAGSPRDYPRGYKVEVSTDGSTWSKPIAEGKGNGVITEITFDPVRAKFVKITQTGAVKGLFWSIHEMEITAPPAVQMASAAK